MRYPRLVSVTPFDSYKLRLEYESGEKKSFDVRPYISGTWFGELKDKAYFQAVRMLSDGSGIEWPRGQDIAPHELYENGVLIES